MKKILAFLLATVMVITTSSIYAFAQENKNEILSTVAEATADEVTTDEATTDEATKDEATKDEPSTDEPTTDEPTTDEPTTDEPSTDEPTTDEPSTDEITTDEDVLRQMVLDYIIKLNGGVNILEESVSSYVLDVVYQGKGAEVRFAILDLNFPEISEDICEAVAKIGDSLLINDVNALTDHVTGMGYYVVLPDTGEVMTLRDALKNNIDTLKDVCIDKDVLRLIGDVDANGEIDIRDATYIQKILAEFEGFEEEWLYGFGYNFSFADFDGDNKVTIKDVTNIQKYLADLEFIFMGNDNVVTTDIPASVGALDIEVTKGWGNYSENYEPVSAFITSMDEFAAVVGENIGLCTYDEAFFETHNIIFIGRTFYSTSFDLEIEAAYVDGNVLYIDTCFMTAAPGDAIVDEAGERCIFIVVDKAATENVERLIVTEDLGFFF